METKNVCYLPWTTILTIIFVVLKLTKAIAWSWWWVLSPLLIVIGIIGIVICIYALIGLLHIFSK
jgi:hypothetical protein